MAASVTSVLTDADAADVLAGLADLAAARSRALDAYRALDAALVAALRQARSGGAGVRQLARCVGWDHGRVSRALRA